MVVNVLANVRIPGLVLILAAMAVVTGCDEQAEDDGIEEVVLSGRTFALELAADNETRMLGMGGRTEIDPAGGMLFVFTDVRLRKFVMRDCSIDIDIIYLDGTGRIVAMHTMLAEEPRREEETDTEYERRLTKYSSRFGSQFAIELRAGTLQELDLEDNQKIDLDVQRLKNLAQ